MMRQFAQITLLTGTLLVGLVPLAMAGSHGMPPVSTGVVAQVTAVDPKTGTATLQTEDGEVFYESKYIVGKVGRLPPGRTGALLTPPASQFWGSNVFTTLICQQRRTARCLDIHHYVGLW